MWTPYAYSMRTELPKWTTRTIGRPLGSENRLGCAVSGGAPTLQLTCISGSQEYPPEIDQFSQAPHGRIDRECKFARPMHGQAVLCDHLSKSGVRLLYTITCTNSMLLE